MNYLTIKKELLEYITSYKNEDFDDSMIGGIDYGNFKIEELSELVDNLKKEVRKLKCEQRKIIKTIEKQKNEASVNV